MTKVELIPTLPSQEAVAKAIAKVQVTDSNGRVITLKKPGVLAQFRLVEVLGESAKNQVYMGMVLPLIFVAAIDDDAVFQPASKREVEALIQRLEEEGVAAVMAGVQENFGASTIEEDKDRLKN